MLIPWTSSLIAAATPAVDVADDGTWTGTIALTNTWSADNRMLALDDDTPVDVRPLPLPVTVQYVTGPRHDGATVGLMTLDEVWRDGPHVMGRGRIDTDDPQGAALVRKIRGGFLRFVSADIDRVDGRAVCIGADGEVIDDCDQDGDGMQSGELYTDWRIMGASLLAHPAFPEAQIQLADEQPAAAAPEQDIAGYNPAWGCVRPDGAGGWQKTDCDAEDAVPAGPDGDRPYDPEPAPDAMTAAAPTTPRTPQPADEDEDTPRGEPTHAGLALKAADTGRVLLLQRALEEDDPAAGLWEFPGGGIETDDGEAPQAAAFREFAEETGIQLPDTVQVVDGWRSPDGVYQGYVAILPAESDIDINPDPDDRDVTNPDDPDGDAIETHAWWDIDALPDMPALRPEVRNTPWDLLTAAAAGETPAADTAPAEPAAAATTTAARAVLTDSLTSAAVHIDDWLPPTEWFRGPDLTDLQPITVDPDGRVRGYLAAWGVSHRSYTGRAVTPPHSPTGYSVFNSRPIHTSEGLVDAGLVTMGTGHASLGLDRRSATAHYDDTGTMAAVVRAGEDSRGIWLAGAVLPDLTDEQRLRLSLSRFSGDWRQEGAGLELVAALAVNTEGFPVPTSRRGDQGDYALVAAGALPAPVPTDSSSGALPAGQLAARVDAAARRVRTFRVQTAARRLRALKTARPVDGDDESSASTPEVLANNLEEYWKRGEGAARIRWGTPGDWTRCHRSLTEHVGDERARRICSQWHHDVTGLWPGDSDNP